MQTLSTAKSDAQYSGNPGGGQSKATKAHRNQRCKFGSGVDVILDHDLKSKRGMIKNGDQEQDHENTDERRSQPGDKGGVSLPVCAMIEATNHNVNGMRATADTRCDNQCPTPSFAEPRPIARARDERLR